MTGDLAAFTAFIAARLDEDEAAAKAAGGEEWGIAGNISPRAESTLVTATVHVQMGSSAEAMHAASHHPARALREVEAKRAILALHPLKIAKHEQYAFSPATGEAILEVYDGDCAICGWFDPEQGACLTLRQLAAVWSDHPDYRAGWKP